MSTTTTPGAAGAFPHIDATRQDCITDEQADFFRRNGLLVIRNVLRGAELRALQDETMPLVRRAVEEKPNDPDYFYRRHEFTGEQVPFRVEYVIDKTGAGRALLGHPFILRSIEKLQGPNFVPTWDSMVFKTEGQGAAIPWHRDAGPYAEGTGVDNDVAAINVDFYLDGSDLTNCLWGILGSNRWPAEEAAGKLKALNQGVEQGEFVTDASTVPITMNPGDVIFHNTLAIHGSPAARSALRRVVYYEFRPGEVELAHGPHTPEYIPLKQKVLLACLRDRQAAPYAAGEAPFSYRGSGRFTPPNLPPDERVDHRRHPHNDFWRA
jgi:ectoine hydroxylase-related dioxygenase (phytanoyl-CoA dioxygenase family)